MPLLSIVLGLSLAHFSGKPVAEEVEKGAKVAAQGKGIDRVLGLNRVSFGSWFDGQRMLNVEQAVIMTPGLLSRWLGHQQVCGLKDIQPVWDRFAAQSNGRTLVFVRLATLNTLDITDGDESETGNPALLDQVTIGFGQMSNRKMTPAQFELLSLRSIQDVQARHPHEVLRTTWDRVVSRVVAWPSEPSADEDSSIRWGRNRLVGFLAELPAVSKLPFGAFQIQTGGATRIVRFEMPKS